MTTDNAVYLLTELQSEEENPNFARIFGGMATLTTQITVYGMAVRPQVTAWWGFWAGGVIGLPTDISENSTINGEHYGPMITIFFDQIE